MARSDYPDKEDKEAERALREYFASEASGLRAPDDLWRRLESNLEAQPDPSRLSAIRDKMFPAAGRVWSPALATAGVAAVAVVVTASVWAATGGFGGEDPPGELAAVTQSESDTQWPSSAPSTLAPAAAEAAAVGATGDIGAKGATGADGAPGIVGANGDIGATRAIDAEPPPADLIMAPAAEAMLAEPAPASPPAAATSAPQPTMAPATALRAADGDMLPEADEFLSDAAYGEAEMAESDAMMASAPAPARSQPEAPTREARPADTTFEDHGRRPFVAAAEDPVSTFSLDADTTSYHLALNWARNGYHVDPESVRAEEWINAFDYGYQHPRGGQEFNVQFDVVRHPLDHGLHLARVAFQAREAAATAPLNVTLVLDASGSMADGDRVAIAREAAESIRGSLGPRDRIAVVHFTESVLPRLTVRHRGADDPDVAWSISRLEPHSSTNVQAGLDLGVRLADLARRERPGAHNYVVLMSDGVANVDATNPFAILESAYDRDAKNPLRIISVGVGINNYNDYLLEQLAHHGNGWYRYLSSTEQARATFSGNNWLALSTPVADQARAQVTWDSEVVQSWRIIGYENRVTPDYTFTQDRREFAELPSGAAATVFYELELRRDAARDRPRKLADVELRWVDPNTGASRRQRGPVVGPSNAAFVSDANPMLQLGAIVALASDRYGGLPLWGPAGLAQARDDLARLLELLQPADTWLGELTAYQDFRFLLGHMSRHVDDLAPTLPSGYKP